ncbi:hypothetical protein, partial [Anaerorhabdus sp.]|uniref:hypothetical protein n=1 Tax=Anaerorhabdus sp. TaxID=1872524 RepID=UPI003043B6B8
METKKLKIVIVIAAIASIIGGLVYVLISNVKQEENVNISPKKVEAVIEELIDWEKRHEINPEFKGQIKFESQLLKENVVQGKDNEKYLALSWDLEETSQGSIFMDYRNHIEDQNLIL